MKETKTNKTLKGHLLYFNLDDALFCVCIVDRSDGVKFSFIFVYWTLVAVIQRCRQIMGQFILSSCLVAKQYKSFLSNQYIVVFPKRNPETRQTSRNQRSENSANTGSLLVWCNCWYSAIKRKLWNDHLHYKQI